MDNMWRAYCTGVCVRVTGQKDGTSVWHVDGLVCAQDSAGGYKKQQLAAAKSKKSEIVHKLMIQSPARLSGIK